MTPVDLIEAVAAELEKATAHFKFIAENQPPKHVSVYRQMAPQDEFETDSFYPLVIVELLSLEDTSEGSLASLLITTGTFCEERRADCWRDHLNLCEEIREYMLAHRTIGKKFILQLPIQFGLVEQQTENFIYSNFFVQYFVAQPIPSVGWVR